MTNELKCGSRFAGRSAARRGSIVTIILLVFASIVVFNVAFLLFAHQAGMYQIVLKKPAELPKPSVTDVDRMIALLQEEKNVIAETKLKLARQEQEAEEVRKQIEVGDKSLESRKQDLAKIQEEIKKSIQVQEVDKEKRLVELVKTFSVMKPDEVVPVFEKLDPETTTSIILRMKPKVSAKIMEKLSPRLAGMITEMIKNK